SAQDLTATLGRLGSPSPYDSNFPPTMKFIAPGRALVAWKEELLPDAYSTNVWPGLRAMLSQSYDELAELRAVVQQPVPAFALDYNQGFNLLLPHLAQLKRAAQWLSAATILNLHERQVSNAWENLTALTAFL